MVGNGNWTDDPVYITNTLQVTRIYIGDGTNLYITALGTTNFLFSGPGGKAAQFDW